MPEADERGMCCVLDSSDSRGCLLLTNQFGTGREVRVPQGCHHLQGVRPEARTKAALQVFGHPSAIQARIIALQGDRQARIFPRDAFIPVDVARSVDVSGYS